jgi:6-pyruvoyltetrahydropterin/6-carboxytetrahydropterin synthase
MRITRRLEFDAGHRIPDHANQCRHLHGHRYAIEITLSGNVITGSDAARRGMVMDFAEVRAIAWRELVDAWDHAFFAWRGDGKVVEFLATMPGHKTVLFDEPPTAEHLALVAFRALEPAYRGSYGNNLKLERVRIYETPSCWADAVRDEW